METLELYSIVALLKDLPEHGLLRGQVGTVVELYNTAAAEIEFVDGEGYTYALTALSAEDLMVLHHRPMALVA